MISGIARTIDLSSPREKILLTPGFVNPGILKRNLALNAGSLAHLKVQPLTEFFVERSIPHFKERTYLSGERLFWLMFDLLQRLKDRLSYFLESVQFEGSCSLMTETIRELRLNALEPSHLRKLANRAKWEDVILILEEYEKLKKKQKLFDYADAVSELQSHVEPIPDIFVIDHPISLLEERFLKSCDVVMINLPDQGDPGYKLSGYKVDTPYQEVLQTIRNVLEDLRSSKVPVRLGICTSDYNETFYMMRQVLDKVAQPDLIHFVKGEPVLNTPAGNLWKYFAEWVTNNMSLHRLLRILESSSFERGDVEPRVFLQAVRYMRASDLLLVDGKFLPAFREMIEGREPVEGDTEREEFEAQASTVALDIAKRFSRLADEGTLEDHLTTLNELFTTSVRVRSEADAVAVVRIEALLEEAIASAATIEAHSTLAEIVRMISEKLDGMYVNATLPDGTRPVLGTPSDLIYFEFDTLYIIGLNEKGPPGIFYENPLLLDDEKKELLKSAPSPRLLLREDRLRLDEQMFGVLKDLARERLILSAPLKDLATGREMLVSRYFLNEWNRYQEHHDDYETLSSKLAESAQSLNNYVPRKLEDALYSYELAVAAHVRHQRARISNGLLEHAFPFSAAVVEFRRARAAAVRFDEYWGVLAVNQKRQLPVMSATKLGLWARCPYQYFLRNELRIDKEEEFDAHSLEWLDALAYGNFLHGLFHRLFLALRKEKGEGFTTVEEGDRVFLEREFEKLVNEFTTIHPVTSEFHFLETLARLRRDVGAYFEREKENNDSRMFAELAFAMGSSSREPQLTKEDPAVIRLTDKSQILVRGAIDRVDRTPEGRYVLIDYKSGRSRRVRETAPFGGGELMQAGLYSEVVDQIDSQIRDPIFKYYYATEKGGFAEHVVDYKAMRNHFLGFLTTIINEIRKGNFVPFVARPDEAPCNFCDYTEVCVERRRWTGERLKADDPNYERYRTITEEERDS